MMSSSSFLMVRAVATMAAVAVLAATAEAAGSYYIPTLATPDFLFSPVFLWVTANVIIVWLVSSSRRRGRATNDDAAASSAAQDDGGGEVVVPGAVDGFYASEYEAFSDAAPSGGRRADDAPVSSKRLTREARAAPRRSDRARVRKKREPPAAGQDAPMAPWATVVAPVAEARDEQARDERRHGQAQEETTPPVTVAADGDAESRPRRSDDDGAVVDDDAEDVSMDSLWASIVQRRAARPVVVQKSESCGNEELPRRQRVAETAADARRQVRKSVSAVAKTAAAPAPPPPPARQAGWRTRDVLVTISPDDLLRRAESFIRRQHEHLRLQRQESEQRQLLLLRRLYGGHDPAPATFIRAGV